MKKKKVKFRIGPPVPKEKLLKQLAKKKHLKLIRSGGTKLN